MVPDPIDVFDHFDIENVAVATAKTIYPIVFSDTNDIITSLTALRKLTNKIECCRLLS